MAKKVLVDSILTLSLFRVIFFTGHLSRILFLKLVNPGSINSKLVEKINSSIRADCSPRHVPQIVLETKDIPYTINGKKVEIAVKRIIDGDKVTNKDALSNPESLKLFQNIPELK